MKRGGDQYRGARWEYFFYTTSNLDALQKLILHPWMWNDPPGPTQTSNLRIKLRRGSTQSASFLKHATCPRTHGCLTASSRVQNLFSSVTKVADILGHLSRQEPMFEPRMSTSLHLTSDKFFACIDYTHGILRQRKNVNYGASSGGFDQHEGHRFENRLAHRKSSTRHFHVQSPCFKMKQVADINTVQ